MRVTFPQGSLRGSGGHHHHHHHYHHNHHRRCWNSSVCRGHSLLPSCSWCGQDHRWLSPDSKERLNPISWGGPDSPADSSRWCFQGRCCKITTVCWTELDCENSVKKEKKISGLIYKRCKRSIFLFSILIENNYWTEICNYCITL